MRKLTPSSRGAYMRDFPNGLDNSGERNPPAFKLEIRGETVATSALLGEMGGVCSRDARMALKENIR